MPIKGIQAVNASKIRGRCESTCICASFTVIFETFSDSNQTTHIRVFCRSCPKKNEQFVEVENNLCRMLANGKLHFENFCSNYSFT